LVREITSAPQSSQTRPFFFCPSVPFLCGRVCSAVRSSLSTDLFGTCDCAAFALCFSWLLSYLCCNCPTPLSSFGLPYSILPRAPPLPHMGYSPRIDLRQSFFPRVDPRCHYNGFFPASFFRLSFCLCRWFFTLPLPFSPSPPLSESAVYAFPPGFATRQFCSLFLSHPRGLPPRNSCFSPQQLSRKSRALTPPPYVFFVLELLCCGSWHLRKCDTFSVNSRPLFLLPPTIPSVLFFRLPPVLDSFLFWTSWRSRTSSPSLMATFF